MQYDTTIEIDATCEEVWAVLSRPDLFPQWDSGVLAVSGADGGAQVGQKVKLENMANPGKAFPLRVTEVDPPQRMVFTGGMPLGLFTGTRTYEVAPSGHGGSRFIMNETYSGPLAGMITKSIPDLQPSFDTFSTGLKARVEGNEA